MSEGSSVSSRPMPEVPGMRHAYADVHGVRLHYAEAGPPDGPAVLLVHGFPQHWTAWRHVVPLLAEDYRLICVDMRGFGWSEGSKDGYSTDERAADLIGFLDALDLPTARLLAHDWGAWAGFLACVRAPERFSHFLALNMVHLWPQRKNTLRNAWRFWYTVALEWPPVGRGVLRGWPAFTRYLMRRGVADRSAWTREELAEFSAAARVPAAARAGEGIHRAFVAKDIVRLRRKEFHGLRLKTPTVILTGDRDKIIPPAILPGGAEFADELQVEIVTGTGHYLPQEQPQAVADAARVLFSS